MNHFMSTDGDGEYAKLYKLPLGLTRYAGAKFDDLHNAGSRCITASSVPDLFGVGRSGRMALAAHTIGMIPFKPVDNPLTRRGHMMQNVVAGWYQEETGNDTKPVHAWVKHDTLAFYASPDAVILPRSPQPRPAEVKVVANTVFNDKWGVAPPTKVLLQHQSQLKLTGASSGPIIASTIGEFDFDLHHWEIEADPEVQEMILEEVKVFLQYVENGQLPPPDLSDEKDQESVVKMAEIMEGKTIDLGDEIMFHIKRYQKIGTVASSLKKKRAEAKAHIVNALKGHQFGQTSSGHVVSLKEKPYAAQTRDAYIQRVMHIKAPPKDKKTKTRKNGV